ncbi:DUF4333 domain-containing protein [Mycolicibacterium sp.]|uniref:DUF4333 domain-containing protein n=1 Tax=Mycolicibacterium sp. TaxID=2320850 RepID=UPI0037C8A158
MTNMTARVLCGAAGTALTAVLLAGCGGAAKVDNATVVSKTDLQKQAKEKLQAAAKKKAKSVVCEDGIEGTVGATQKCVLTSTDGKKWAVTATVTAVKDGKATIDFKTAKDPIQ